MAETSFRQVLQLIVIQFPAKKVSRSKLNFILCRPFLIPMYLKKYPFNRDESHMTFREEKLIYFSDNHVSIELENRHS